MRSECSEFENAAPVMPRYAYLRVNFVRGTQMLLGQAGRKYLHEYKSNQNFLHFAGESISPLDVHNVLIHISWTLTSTVQACNLAQSVEHGANNAVVTGSIPVVSNTPQF